MLRKCDHCGKEYNADERNLKRGWGLTCSKSCAAKKREMSKPNYNPNRVKANNIRRAMWVGGYDKYEDYDAYEMEELGLYNSCDDDHPFSSDGLGQW